MPFLFMLAVTITSVFVIGLFRARESGVASEWGSFSSKLVWKIQPVLFILCIDLRVLLHTMQHFVLSFMKNHRFWNICANSSIPFVE